ncbi:hypothetical protein ACIRL2_41235 [Embleya sp. NPDC127516]|uniref:hypothetical protein n=1 Tax=Embleya sp. NPDC127516 TaxID=3363990 RepID=UPI0037F192E8
MFAQESVSAGPGTDTGPVSGFGMGGGLGNDRCDDAGIDTDAGSVSTGLPWALTPVSASSAAAANAEIPVLLILRTQAPAFLIGSNKPFEPRGSEHARDSEFRAGIPDGWIA